MTDSYPILSIPDSELADWYNIGWTFLEPAEVPGFSVIAWDQNKPAVMPFAPSRRLPDNYVELNRVPEVEPESAET